MTLTPIHVRGKRKTPRSNPPLALGGRPQHHDDHHDPQQPHQSPARPRKSLSSVVAERPSRRRATLDSLPTEILESILLYCTNLSLPHASPLIALKLSDTVTLLRLFIEAFSATWETWFGVVASRQVLHGPRGPEGRHDFDHGDPVLQSAILRQPWAKIDLILRAQQIWADRHARGRWYQHTIPWDDDEDAEDDDGASSDSPSSPEIPSGLPTPPGPQLPRLDRSHPSSGHGHFDSTACFEADYARALRWTPFRLEFFGPWGGRDVHPATRLPDRLVTGPWDDEQQRRLFWLARGGIRLAHADDQITTPHNGMSRVYLSGNEDDSAGPDIPWESKLEFIRNAVIDAQEPNLVAVNCLMGSWAFRNLPRDVARGEMARIDTRLKYAPDGSRTKQILRRTEVALAMFS